MTIDNLFTMNAAFTFIICLLILYVAHLCYRVINLLSITDLIKAPLKVYIRVSERHVFLISDTDEWKNAANESKALIINPFGEENSNAYYTGLNFGKYLDNYLDNYKEFIETEGEKTDDSKEGEISDANNN